MTKFAVTKDGALVGRPFDLREEALEVADLERLHDPSADIQVQQVLTVGEGLDPDEGQALVDAILEGADFSDLPLEHRGPIDPSYEEQGKAALDADPGRSEAEKWKKAEHGKKGKATPVKGSSFFVQHPHHVPVADEVLEELWVRDTIGVRLPGGVVGGGKKNLKTPGPKKFWEKMAARQLKELSYRGGYAWVETRVRPGVAKIGRIVPQEPGDVRAAWSAPKHHQHEGAEPGQETEVVLRTLQLEDVVEVTLDDVLEALRAERPLGGTILRWRAAGSRLEGMVEGVPLKRTWANLTPLQQRAACAEFLRANRKKPMYPKLRHLLTPSGIKFEHVDILGLEENGTEICARVTSAKKGSPSARSEAWALEKHHRRPGRKLILFCEPSGDPDPARSSPVLFPTEPFQVPPPGSDVLLVSVDEVLKWVKGQTVYADKLFSL